MLKVHKIALNPNNIQSTLLSQHCGYARVAYNHALADFKEGLDNKEWNSEMDLRRRFNAIKKDTYSWCKDHSQHVAKNAIRNLGNAIKCWKSGQNRFPRFKKRSRGQSYQADNGRGTIFVEGKRIKLPKIGWVRIYESLRFLGIICKVTISKQGHRWFASILVDTFEEEIKPDLSNKPIIGVDVGIKHLAITSEGEFFENPKVLKKYEKKLSRFQRRLSKRIKGSNNWYEMKEKIAKLHYRIFCIRNDSHHKATTSIVNSARCIGIESLNVSGMLKNRRLSKALSDASLSNFLTLLKSKSDYLGLKVVEADRFYPSSKTCSNCGSIDKTLSLSDRLYHCDSCRFEIDRDLNAAINLKHLAVSYTES